MLLAQPVVSVDVTAPTVNILVIPATLDSKVKVDPGTVEVYVIVDGESPPLPLSLTQPVVSVDVIAPTVNVVVTPVTSESKVTVEPGMIEVYVIVEGDP